LGFQHSTVAVPDAALEVPNSIVGVQNVTGDVQNLDIS